MALAGQIDAQAAVAHVRAEMQAQRDLGPVSGRT